MKQSMGSRLVLFSSLCWLVSSASHTLQPGGHPPPSRPSTNRIPTNKIRDHVDVSPPAPHTFLTRLFYSQMQLKPMNTPVISSITGSLPIPIGSEARGADSCRNLAAPQGSRGAEGLASEGGASRSQMACPESITSAQPRGWVSCLEDPRPGAA